MEKVAFALVGLFYPAIVLIAVLLLASVQLRSPSGSAFDTWRLNYNANRVLDRELLKQRGELRTKVRQNFDDINFTDLCLNFYNADGTYKDSIDSNILGQAKAARSAGLKSDDYVGDMRCLVRGYTIVQYDKRYFEGAKEELAKDVADLDKAVISNNEQHTNLIKGRHDFLAFKEMENLWYSSPVPLIPYDLMVLLLVMFMGALGGMVRILRDYGDPNRKSPASSEYFFIPLIGLVVGIGGYVLAKTGLLLLSTNKEEASLSPFMIGLVGIASGLLAKDVIDALGRAGIRIVNPPPPAAGQSGAGSGPPAEANSGTTGPGKK